MFLNFAREMAIATKINLQCKRVCKMPVKSGILKASQHKYLQYILLNESVLKRN